MSDKPTITLTGARGDEWAAILGTPTFAIQSPVAEECNLEGIGRAQCVFLDVAALTHEQQGRLINYMAKKAGAALKDVTAQVFGRGVPIRLDTDTKIDPGGWRRRGGLARGTPGAIDMRLLT